MSNLFGSVFVGRDYKRMAIVCSYRDGGVCNDSWRTLNINKNFPRKLPTNNKNEIKRTMHMVLKYYIRPVID